LAFVADVADEFFSGRRASTVDGDVVEDLVEFPRRG
jgi:hypothetical protein